MPKKIKKILLVDDNPVAQTLSGKMFANDGYQVILAGSERECLEKAKAEMPDAILMDVILPDSNGKAIVQKLKADPQTAGIPIVFATNTINVKNDKGSASIVVDGTPYRAFAKPLHYAKILSVVRKEINRRTS
jgi:CheY-like chemotaxis protein